MSWLLRMEIETAEAYSRHIRDTYSWHQRIWECFPGKPDKKRDFLTRIDYLEDAFRVWVLANSQPVCPEWCCQGNFNIKKIEPSFLSHRYYAFDLRANPVKAIVQRDVNGEPLRNSKGKRKHGKRIPVVNLDELREWLNRKGAVRCRNTETGENVPGGFRILEDKPLEIFPMSEFHFKRKGQKAFHGGVQFRGILEMTDAENFTESYYHGIGSAKGFGFGLLLLAPVKM